MIGLIQKWEKLRLKAYRDMGTRGTPTIGWGTIRYSNGVAVKMGDTITKERADSELMVEVNGMIKKLHLLITVPMTPYQWEAILSFCYNEGVGAFQGSTLRRLINAGTASTDPRIKANFLAWRYDHDDHGSLVEVEGLKNRRQDEWEMFITPVEGKKANA
jgi:lysozyme